MTPSRPRQIFLVDDHPLVLEGLVKLIDSTSDLKVCGTAQSVNEALSALTRISVDTLVTDLSLKGESGYDLLTALKERFPAIPVLVLSMHEDVSFAERALSAGAQGFISKSHTTEEILSAIRQVLEGHVYVDESVLKHILEKKASAGTTPEALLSSRELEVFRLLGMGYKTRRIAATLKVSPKTVDSHCANIKAKLKLGDAHELVQQAVLWLHRS